MVVGVPGGREEGSMVRVPFGRPVGGIGLGSAWVWIVENELM